MRSSFIVILLIVTMPLIAIAAPFCVKVQGIREDCIYDDTSSCKTRAAQLSGICIVNTSEITMATGREKFCLVDSSRMPQCVYADRSGCEAAQRNESVCIINTFHKDNEEQADPFEVDPNRNY